MLTGLIFLCVVSGIVCLIEWQSNRNYDQLVAIHTISVTRRVKSMDMRDVNWLLECTGKYVEIADRLVETHQPIIELRGFIPRRVSIRLLIEELGG